MAERAPRRVGMVIGLRPEMEARYRELHADPWRSVLERITRSNIRNYSIYLARLGEQTLLFSHFEYVGEDYEADMARIAADPETQRWWQATEPCQLPLEGRAEGAWWTTLAEVFYHP